jgi:methylmalonyl-CoA/ethylmalonyl-CoA epimerase
MAPIRPSHVAQVAVPIHDLERAKRFYGQLLGLTHLFDAPPGLSFFQCGETRLMLSQPEGPQSAAASIVYYQVEDLDVAHAALAGEGVAFDSEPHFVAKLGDKDLWLALCQDSEGNMLGLMSYR